MEEISATYPTYQFYGVRLCAHARKTIPLAPIHSFTKQIVPSMFDLKLFDIHDTSFPYAPYKLLPSIKNILGTVIFFFLSTFFYFHRTLVGLCDPRHESRNLYFNTYLVHRLVCLITYSFLHGFQPNLYQHFSYVCSIRQTTFSIKQIPQCI